jgi:hypothetical protein
VQLEETPIEGTLVVFNGTVPVSAALYSVVSNKITFTDPQTGIMIRYQTSAFARAGLPACKNFYSPLLFEFPVQPVKSGVFVHFLFPHQSAANTKCVCQDDDVGLPDTRNPRTWQRG